MRMPFTRCRNCWAGRQPRASASERSSITSHDRGRWDSRAKPSASQDVWSWCPVVVTVSRVKVCLGSKLVPTCRDRDHAATPRPAHQRADSRGSTSSYSSVLGSSDRLLISGSKVRVLDVPPTKSGASDDSGRPRGPIRFWGQGGAMRPCLGPRRCHARYPRGCGAWAVSTERQPP